MKRLLVAALTGAVGLTLLSPVGSAFSDGVLSDNTGAVAAPVQALPAADPAAPQLAAAADAGLPVLSYQSAEQIIAADSFIQSLMVGGGTYSITNSGSWTSANGTQIGADMELTLSVPFSGSRYWPKHKPLDVAPYYLPTTYVVQVNGAATLDVLVDLTLQKVVDVSVNPLAIVLVGLDGPVDVLTATGDN
jgi:hypothetical protein